MDGTVPLSTAWVLWWNHTFIAAYATEEAAREDLSDAQRVWPHLHGAKGSTWHIARLDIRPQSGRLTQAKLRAATRMALAAVRDNYGHVDADTWAPQANQQSPLTVPGAQGPWMPGFQFERPGQMRPGVSAILALFRSARWDDESITIWMSTPQAATNGREPAAILAYDPMFVLDAVYAMNL